jgi:hypothetical protein
MRHDASCVTHERMRPHEVITGISPFSMILRSGMHMQGFPIHDIIPLDQRYPELTKSSSHEGGGSDVRPSRRRGGSSGGKGLQELHHRPAQAPVGLYGDGSLGATCHLPAVFAELGRVPQGGCCTCCVCCPLEEAVGGRVDHRNVCDHGVHQAFGWQYHQHVTALQGRPPCACPKPLHCRLHGGRNPSTMSNAAPRSKSWRIAMPFVRALAALRSHRPPPAASVTRPGGGACRWQRRHPRW